MQLEDWLDDLCVRFIVNLPPEELVSVERICFQVEEAQWFYEDFIRPLDPSLPSLSLKAFSLRIFQHCPLFATWSMQHYTSAFAEFLAYKQRVPVRGAIMLNEELDEVVLVKGWKKGANWSFPRGKINKDENDLDCAIREVYEETGYDIQAAGLVKPEKDMKYIEVTMREQHMRLYVFRGVPKNTHFEPKTRKEISKIEWYKLTDLPTLKKKNTHHDAQDDNAGLNANKFYMVAPFLHPLKKWIAQQKKKDNRYSSSHLAAPPMFIDESATEGEPGPTEYPDHPPQVLSPAVPSSLPELATSQPHNIVQDPSSHLKELLKIGPTPAHPSSDARPVHIPNADTTKSNALLALLRNGSTADARNENQAPSTQALPPSGIVQQPYRPLDVSGAADVPRPLQLFNASQVQLPNQQQSLLDLFANARTDIPRQRPQEVVQKSPERPGFEIPGSIQQPVAPYQRTGDPQFARNSPEETRNQVVPPAHALPKLTHHTRALLDAFRSPQLPTARVAEPVQKDAISQLAPGRQALLDVFKTHTPVVQLQSSPLLSVAPSPPISQLAESPAQTPKQDQPHTRTRVESSNASSLLSLFRGQGTEQKTSLSAVADPPQPPVELAAGSAASPKPQEHLDPLAALLRKDAPKRPPQAIRAGETAATVDGPLNQPQFEMAARSPSQISMGSLRRSPVPAHRTLFDPKQPTPSKILQRPEESKRGPAKSPRQPKATVAAPSPKQKVRGKQEKTFQPQILKRPQNTESHEGLASSPTLLSVVEEVKKPASPLPAPIAASPLPARLPTASQSVTANPSRRASQQTESQKQNLLSLLTGSGGPVLSTRPIIQTPTAGAISPLTQSQIVSPLSEDQPISTRSRMDSLVSIASAGPYSDNRPKVEKRQTAAGDKAFLLGYLGRIASEGDQTQQ